MRAALNKASFGVTAEGAAALANSAAAISIGGSGSGSVAAAGGSPSGRKTPRQVEEERKQALSASGGGGSPPHYEDVKHGGSRGQSSAAPVVPVPPASPPPPAPPGAQIHTTLRTSGAVDVAAGGANSSLSTSSRLHRSGVVGINVSLGPAALSTTPLPKYTLPKADKLYELNSAAGSDASGGGDAPSGPPLTGLAALAANTSAHHTLPLELFDSDESDKSPAEWVSESSSKYGGLGVPARSLYYHNRQWKWAPCRVVEWNPVSEHFIITFPPNTHTKDVKRLSILFDGEDEKKFLARVEKCRLLRDEAMSHRRYLQFIDHQPSDIFAPLQKTAVHGIIGLLMKHSEELVLARQKTVETSLGEVRSEYSRAMKAAIIEYKRRSPDEERKLAPLGLPPRTMPKRAPAKAVIVIPGWSGVMKLESVEAMKSGGRSQETRLKYYDMFRKISVLKQFVGADFHYTIHQAATNVILNLHKAWDALNTERFFHMDHNVTQHRVWRRVPNSRRWVYEPTSPDSTGLSPLELPITIEDYVMKQEIQFTAVRDKVCHTVQLVLFLAFVLTTLVLFAGVFALLCCSWYRIGARTSFR